MKPRRYRPSQAACLLNISPWTLRRWIREGKVPHLKTDTGRIFVPAHWVEAQVGASDAGPGMRCAVYARESSSEHKAALDTQTEGLRQYAMARGYQSVRVVQEIGPGVHDERPKLHQPLAQRDFDALGVAHKDRLTRCGFRWFEALCPFRIAVVNIAENPTNDLMEDLVALLTSFSARLYGPRRGRTKTQVATQSLVGIVMKKRYKRTSQPTMRRSARVFLNEVNGGKARTLTAFLHTCHDATQYFIDLFWQRQDFSPSLADLDTVHQGRDRFGLTTRLAPSRRSAPSTYLW